MSRTGDFFSNYAITISKECDGLEHFLVNAGKYCFYIHCMVQVCDSKHDKML